jgi:hypothetical protein
VTDTRHLRPLSLVEIEERIQVVMTELEAETEAFDDIAREAAEAEADYRHQSAMAMLAVLTHGEKKMTVSERAARVDSMTADAHKTFLVRQAARNSKREHLQTLRGIMDALRTLNASVRGQT